MTPSGTFVASGAMSAARTAPSIWKSAPSVSGAKRQDWVLCVSIKGSEVIRRTARSAWAAVRPETSAPPMLTPCATTLCSGSPAACCARAPASTPIMIMARKATKVSTRAPRRDVR